MPKVSIKNKILAAICRTAEFEIDLADSNTQVNYIFDDTIDNILLLSQTRYAISRLLFPKSNQWYTKFLPIFDHFAIQTLCTLV